MEGRREFPAVDPAFSPPASPPLTSSSKLSFNDFLTSFEEKTFLLKKCETLSAVETRRAGASKMKSVIAWPPPPDDAAPDDEAPLAEDETLSRRSAMWT